MSEPTQPKGAQTGEFSPNPMPTQVVTDPVAPPSVTRRTVTAERRQVATPSRRIR
jgi:hypothetical protein